MRASSSYLLVVRRRQATVMSATVPEGHRVSVSSQCAFRSLEDEKNAMRSFATVRSQENQFPLLIRYITDINGGSQRGQAVGGKEKLF